MLSLTLILSTLAYNLGDKMKKITNTQYAEKKPTHERIVTIINKIPEHCWWVRQYLRGTLYDNKGRYYARDTD